MHEFDCGQSIRWMEREEEVGRKKGEEFQAKWLGGVSTTSSDLLKSFQCLTNGRTFWHNLTRAEIRSEFQMLFSIRAALSLIDSVAGSSVEAINPPLTLNPNISIIIVSDVFQDSGQRICVSFQLDSFIFCFVWFDWSDGGWCLARNMSLGIFDSGLIFIRIDLFLLFPRNISVELSIVSISLQYFQHFLCLCVCVCLSLPPSLPPSLPLCCCFSI